MNTEQERAELLPCPFCGAGTTEVRENGRPWLGTRWGDPVSVSVRHWCEPVVGQPSRMIERVGRDRASAIDAWNRRAAPQSQSMSPEISRDLLGKIVDEVFDGAIEDASVIEDIYRVVARECALQSQDREDGFSDGVLLALQMMTDAGDAGSHLHFELIKTAGLEKIVRRALQEGMWELAGLDAPMSESAREAIDHARRAEDKT